MPGEPMWSRMAVKSSTKQWPVRAYPCTEQQHTSWSELLHYLGLCTCVYTHHQ